MRFVKLALPLLLAALLVAGCDRVTAPKPNPKGDAAFVQKLAALCAQTTTPLVPMPVTGDLRTAVREAAANDKTLTNFQLAMLTLTPMLSHASPLVQPVTSVEQDLVEAEYRYNTIIGEKSAKGLAKDLAWMPARALKRVSAAQAALTQLGIKSCRL